VEVWTFVDGVENLEEVGARFGFEDDLPCEALAGAFVEGGHWWRDGELLDLFLAGVLSNFLYRVRMFLTAAVSVL
jgi:hypothetical protein